MDVTLYIEYRVTFIFILLYLPYKQLCWNHSLHTCDHSGKIYTILLHTWWNFDGIRHEIDNVRYLFEEPVIC